MSWLSKAFGGGGSKSSSSTTNQTTLNTTTTTIIETDKLAEALQNQAEAMENIGSAEVQLKVAETNAKLNQNALFFNEIEGGLKKWAFLGIFAYGSYRIFKKGKLI